MTYQGRNNFIGVNIRAGPDFWAKISMRSGSWGSKLVHF